MKAKKILVMLFVMVFVFSAFAKVAISDMEIYTYKIVDKYWQMKDLFYKLQDKKQNVSEKQYAKLSTDVENMVENLSEYITDGIKKGDVKRLKKFAEIYKNLPNEVKGIFTPVINDTKEVLNANPSVRAQEYFPGYGYTEPGYDYRRGKEVRREVLQKFWKTEERYFEKNKHYKFYVELGVQGSLEGQVEGLKVLKVAKMNINGSWKQVAEVEFNTKETLTTKCVVAYQKVKVWFELWRKKPSFLWWGGTWERCGETYQIMEEATDTQVIVNAPGVAGAPSEAPKR